MKLKAINGRWVIWTTNAIADWDGLTGDPALDSGWEACRFRSMHRHLVYGDTFFDIGTEHGSISTVIAREFVGAENMVLFEPSSEFWPNIAKHWNFNGLAKPLGFWDGFVGEVSSPDIYLSTDWPGGSDDMRLPETDGMAYRHLARPGEIQTISLDDYTKISGVCPNAINIDVEGAEMLVLKGSTKLLTSSDNDSLKWVWVSIHPDLMIRDFDNTKQELLEFMSSLGWQAEYLGTDHEEHYLFERISNLNVS